jgi:hypothetical protein
VRSYDEHHYCESSPTIPKSLAVDTSWRWHFNEELRRLSERWTGHDQIDQAYAVDQLAEFVVTASQTDLSRRVLRALKRNVLDSIACAVGALDGELTPAVRAHAEQFSGHPTATFVGGGRGSVDQAAFFNAVLVRYPDLLDTYLTPAGLPPR